MVSEALEYVPTTLAWAAVAYKLPAAQRHPGPPARRALWLTLLFLALAQTVLLPAVYLTVDRLIGIGNLSLVLGNGLILLAAWSVQAFLLHLNYPDERAGFRIRRRASALVGTLALMIAFFALAPVHHETVDFWREYGRAPYIVDYRLLYLSYLGMALGNLVRLSWRYAGVTDHPALSLGLRVVALGGLFGLGYVLHEGLRVILLALRHSNAFLDSDAVTRVLVAAAIGLTIVGATMPTWGRHLGIPTLSGWLAEYRSYRHLYPLWLAHYRANPQIALLPPRSALHDAIGVRDLNFRLYRRVVEIRDGCLALRPYVDSSVVAAAAERCRTVGLSSEETEATVEAATLAGALERRRAGRPCQGEPSAWQVPGGRDLQSEVRALERVARCYRRSLIVRTVLQELHEREGGVRGS